MAESSYQKKIEFYSHKERHWGNFSNFARYPITLDNKTWKTTEHYFQAQKFVGTEYEELVRQAETPLESCRLGKNRKFPLRKDWEDVKESVMKKALVAKFLQHQKLKNLLLSTGSAYLVEHTKKDRYWGDGGDSSPTCPEGKNRLGFLLMELREELRKSAEDASGKNDKMAFEEGEAIEKSDDEDFEEGHEDDGTQKVSRRTARQRKKRNIYKEPDGSAIFEKSESGAVRIVGTNIEIQSEAVDARAKLVMHRNQFKKKRERVGQGPIDLKESYDEDEIIDEESQSYLAPKKSNSTLSDYFSGNMNEKLLKNDKKEASKITNEIQTQLEVLSTLEQDSDLLNDILVSCQMVKEKAIGYIENAMQQEHTSVELSKLMELLDSLNTTLQSYQLTAK